MLFGLVIARRKSLWNETISSYLTGDTMRIQWKHFAKNDWFYAWYITVILQVISEFFILRPERRFKLQKILSRASIMNQVLDNIKVDDMHWNGVSPLPEPWWPSSWTLVCVIGLQCYLSIIVVETIIKGHIWERQRIEKLLDSGVTRDTPI